VVPVKVVTQGLRYHLDDFENVMDNPLKRTSVVASRTVISHFQTKPLVQYRDAGWERIAISPDLGLTSVEVVAEPAGVRFPNSKLLTWDVIEEINASENNCFVVENDVVSKVVVFSELTNRLYTLMPTPGAPTMLVSGIPMHRIKGTDPHQDTVEKMKTVRPVLGRVLDTATGLGYTAIEAAKTADQVITVELEPAVLEIARMNPWSRELFANPRITQYMGDSYEVVKEFDEETFTRIIHDPPTMKLAGHLYSREFYWELYRVLQRGGRMFHYVGDPRSRSGQTVTRGVVRRLQEVGFSRVVSQPRAFGVVAAK
jgi:predicted methyltransferase